jgi:ubiquinone/menaquinone biosynthesis C-methylase UbiE
MEFLNIEKTLDELDLRKDMVAVDFGCGSGQWVLPLAKQLEDGKVYAIDILEEPLSALESKARTENLLNIETIRFNIEGGQGLKLSAASIDLVLMTNLLFECEDKKSVFEQAKNVLKGKGQILVVDWRKDAPFGPEKEIRVSADEIRKIAENLGLKLQKEFDAGKYHYGMVFQKF